MTDKLYEIVSRVMNVPTSEITDESSPETIESWDSFSGYVLLDEIETEFDVKFTLDETLTIKNIGDFTDFMHESLSYLQNYPES